MEPESYDPPPSPDDQVDNLCLIAPWLALILKKGKYSFVELWLFVTVWGFSAGPLIFPSFLNEYNRRQYFWWLVFLEYLALHLHTALFVAVVDTLNWRSGVGKETRYQRLFFIVGMQLILTFLFWVLTFGLRK